MNKSCITVLCTAALAFTMTAQVHARTGGPDTFGYTFIDSDTDPALTNYMDISATGDQVLLGDDEMSTPVSIGFMFNYYGTEYMEFYISSNGFLTFLAMQDPEPSSDELPMAGDPDAVIAGWWDDLDPSDPDSGSVYTKMLGTEPNRVLIVQFTEIVFAGSRTPDKATFQFKLFEGSNNIEVQYLRIDTDNGVFSGIENQSGTDGLAYISDADFDLPPLPAAVQYRFPNNPPDCTDAEPSIERLWPPNHKFVPIEILGVTDPDGDPVNITIDSIFQDEPINTFGDGNTQPDGKGVGTSIAQVRSERSGNKKVPGNGRVYHIGFTADDGNQECTGVVTVAGVPHDQGRKGRVIIDGGPLYDSTVVPANSRPGNSNNASKKSRGKKKK